MFELSTYQHFLNHSLHFELMFKTIVPNTPVSNHNKISLFPLYLLNKPYISFNSLYSHMTGFYIFFIILNFFYLLLSISIL